MQKPLAARMKCSTFNQSASKIVDRASRRGDDMNRYRKSMLPAIPVAGANWDSWNHALRRVLPAITFCCCVVALSAQPNSITLDNHPVHPTRILAKFKDGALSTWSTEVGNQIGSRVH